MEEERKVNSKRRRVGNTIQREQQQEKDHSEQYT